MGRLSSLLLPLLATVSTAAAQAHTPYVTPEWEAQATAVSSMTAKYTQYITYAGPTGTAAAEVASSSKVEVQVAVATSSASCSYWLDEIQHQGE